MDAYLYQAALIYDLQNDAKTWVLADVEDKVIAGYFTLKCASVSLALMMRCRLALSIGMKVKTVMRRSSSIILAHY